MTTSEREMLDLFVQESNEHLNALETDLVALETHPTHATLLNRIFRSVHSVKGTAGFFGFSRIGELAHAMESVMALLRDGKMTLNAAMIDLFLAAADKLRVMVAAPASSSEVDASAQVTALKALLEVRPPAVASSSPRIAIPEWLKPFALDPELFRNALSHGHQVFAIRLRFLEDMQEKGRTPIDVLNEIHSLGTFFDTYTDISSVSGLGDSIEAELTCVILFATVMDEALLCAALGLGHDQVEQVSRDFIRAWLATQPAIVPRRSENYPAALAPPSPTPAKPSPAAREPSPTSGKPSPTSGEPPPVSGEPPPAAKIAPPAAGKIPANTGRLPEAAGTGPSAPSAPSSAPEHAPEPPATPHAQRAARSHGEETVRVSVGLLDDLMNLAGELVLGRNQLLRLGEPVSREVPGLPGVLQSINRVTSALQGRIMRTRLQPVGGLLGKFPRVVRDLSQKLGKEIDLEMSGEDVELDRTLMEGLSDPLTHLIRNCTDHGIEPPEVREASGKPRVGRIRIAAAHVGGRVQIEVSDDGRGLDPERLKAKAIEKGLLLAAEAERLTARQAQALIFLPGFSTAVSVSDVSGRGVGMDVVKTNIEKLGGHVELDSEPGHGLRVVVRLPLTLAIVPALLVSQGGQRFAVPQVNLEEIVRIDATRPLEIVRASWVLRLRERLLPVCALAPVLADQALPIVPPAEGYVLVLKVENQRYGLLVERVLDSEEIVVKPLGRYVKSARLFSGTTILGDGRVAMILDTAGIADAARIGFAENQAPATAAARTGETQSLLLFNTGGAETLAIHLATVSRIERITPSQIQRVGDREFLRYGESSLRLLRLPQYLPITPSPSDGEALYIIVPKLVHQPMGLIAANILDVVQVPVNLDTRTIAAPGLLGSAIIAGTLTLLLDIYRLLETVEPGSGHAPAAQRIEKARVLYAEDTAFFRTVVGDYLRSVAGHVEFACDGIEAWDRLQHGQYDVLLTDIEMPRLNGFELTRRIRASETLKHLPIVALSSQGNDRHITEGRAAGVDHYEVKFDKARLHTALAEILGRAIAAKSPGHTPAN